MSFNIGFKMMEYISKTQSSASRVADTASNPTAVIIVSANPQEGALVSIWSFSMQDQNMVGQRAYSSTLTWNAWAAEASKSHLSWPTRHTERGVVAHVIPFATNNRRYDRRRRSEPQHLEMASETLCDSGACVQHHVHSSYGISWQRRRHSPSPCWGKLFCSSRPRQMVSLLEPTPFNTIRHHSTPSNTIQSNPNQSLVFPSQDPQIKHPSHASSSFLPSPPLPQPHLPPPSTSPH